jgi:hypothetical protein
MPAQFDVPLPIKGVNRYFSRSQQPADTCWDALNMFPFDRYGRRRIAQRPGCGRLYEDILGLTVEAGSTTTTVVDVGLADTGFNEESVFGIVVFDAATPTVALRNVQAIILSYDIETDVITLATALPAVPAVGDIFSITRVLTNPNQRVSLIGRTDVAGAPTVIPTTVLFSDNFDTYPNGTLLHLCGGIADALYQRVSPIFANIAGAGTSTTFGTGIVASSSTAFRVTNPGDYVDAPGANDQVVFAYAPNPALGTTYRIAAEFSFPVVSNVGGSMGLFFRGAAFGVGGNMSACITRNTTTGGWIVSILHNSSTNVLTVLASTTFPGVFLNNKTVQFAVNVSGDLITVDLDNQNVLGVVSSLLTGNSRVGFLLNTAAGTSQFRLGSFSVATGTAVNSVVRERLFAVSGRTVHVGAFQTGLPIASAGLDVLRGPASRPSFAAIDRLVFFVDGSDAIYQMDAILGTMQTYTASSGVAPQKCTLAASWRGRLVLAAPTDNPQNFFFSRVGDPRDWNYAATDSAAAFSGNAGTLGKIGEPITAIIPFSDDTLVIGTTRSIYIVNGDPADGGTIDLITTTTGIFQSRSWAIDSSGALWFVGQGGLFKMDTTPGSVPQPVSSTVYPQFFTDLNPGTQFIDLAWDNDRFGVWVTATQSANTASTHLFVDGRAGGFWPVQWPNTHGPFAILPFYGNSPDDRTLLLGSRNGRIYSQSTRTRRDEALTPINAYLEIGPMRLNPRGDSVVTTLDVTGGEVRPPDLPSAWQMNYEIQGGKTANAVTEGAQRFSAIAALASADGLVLTRVVRVRGGWHTLRFSNSADGNYFSIETIKLGYIPAGELRAL